MMNVYYMLGAVLGISLILASYMIFFFSSFSLWILISSKVFQMSNLPNISLENFHQLNIQ